MPVTVEIPKEKWNGAVREITFGATAAQGGSRAKTVTVGGAKALPFLSQCCVLVLLAVPV